MKYLASLGATEVRQHVAQSHTLWGDGLTEESRFETQMRRLKVFGPDTFVMSGFLLPDGTLVASCKRYYFSVNWHGEELKAIGLGAIFTDPRHRGQGHAHNMIETVLKESVEQRGCRAALLYSDIGTDFYSAIGFQAMPAQSWAFEVDDVSPVGALPIREIPDGDIDPAIHWHGKFSKRFPLAQKRESSSYGILREFNGLEKEVEILTDDGEPIGMFTYRINRQAGKKYLPDDSIWVYDWLVPEEAESRAWSTVVRLGREAEVALVRGWKSCQQTLPEAAKCFPRDLAIPMIRSLDRGLVFKGSDLESSFFTSVDHF